MVKRKVGALEKIDADLQVLANQPTYEQPGSLLSTGPICSIKSKEIPRTPKSLSTHHFLTLTPGQFVQRRLFESVQPI